jgi:hypothetical protein
MRFWFIFRRRLGAVGLEVASGDRATIVPWLHGILGPNVGLWRLAFDLREREFKIISIKWRKSNYIINTSVIYN